MTSERFVRGWAVLMLGLDAYNGVQAYIQTNSFVLTRKMRVYLAVGIDCRLVCRSFATLRVPRPISKGFFDEHDETVITDMDVPCTRESLP